MRTLKRAGASLLALGVVAAGMVMTAPGASAHTGTLTTSSVCQSDGTYKITYTGTTSNVPQQGPGHTATLTIGEVQPTGSTISGAPGTVVGNTTYTFQQTVSGSATYAQATTFLVWGDGVKSDPIGRTSLRGDCSAPRTPSGDLSTSCVNGGGHVAASNLSNGTAHNVTWRLVSGTDASHTTVVAGPSEHGPLTASGLADLTKVWLQYKIGEGNWVDEGSVVTTGNCTLVVVAPSGDLDTSCVNGGGHVAASNLSNGTAHNVTWRLVSGTDASHITVVAGPSERGPLTASGLADLTKVWLQYKIGEGNWVDEGSVVTTGNCTPVVVAPTGSFTVVCTATGGNVTIGALSSGSRHGVVWTLTYGSQSKTVSSGDVVAVPALAALALKFTTASDDSSTVQGGTAPEACAPTGQVDKTSQPASGSVVSQGQNVIYTVTVKNTGTVKIESQPAVDTLPDHVSLVAGSITGGGTASADGGSITWSVTLDPQDSATYTYQVTVDADAPARATLLNRMAFLQDEATTTHEVGDRSLDIVKAVDPTGPVNVDGVLTYTLVVTAGGSLGQTNVVVSDYIPGYKPGRESGLTTYVDGSAGCVTGTCPATYELANQVVTWSLGDMAAGASRSVTFQVKIDPVTDAAAETTIFNSATVGSTETAPLPSNEVDNAVIQNSSAEVLGVKQGKPAAGNQPAAAQGTVLPHTGAPVQLPWALGGAALLLLLGSALIFVARKPEVVRVR